MSNINNGNSGINPGLPPRTKDNSSNKTKTKNTNKPNKRNTQELKAINSNKPSNNGPPPSGKPNQFNDETETGIVCLQNSHLNATSTPTPSIGYVTLNISANKYYETPTRNKEQNTNQRVGNRLPTNTESVVHYNLETADPFCANRTLSRSDEEILDPSISRLITENDDLTNIVSPHTQNTYEVALESGLVSEFDSVRDNIGRTDPQKRGRTHNISTEETSPAHKQSRLNNYDVDKRNLELEREEFERKKKQQTNLMNTIKKGMELEIERRARAEDESKKLSNEVTALKEQIRGYMEDHAQILERMSVLEYTVQMSERKLQNLTKQNTILRAAIGENEEVISEILRCEAELADENGPTTGLDSQSTLSVDNGSQNIAEMREERRFQQESYKTKQY